jgi:hypothetical protein
MTVICPTTVGIQDAKTKLSKARNEQKITLGIVDVYPYS